MAIDWRLDRRGVFYGAAAALAGGFVALKGSASPRAKTPKANLVSAARIAEIDGGALIGVDGLVGFALPGRAHALTGLPWGEVVLVGRRPGSFAAFIDPQSPNAVRRLFAPVAGHRFAGHAAFSPDRNMLATSEIDAETGDGLVAIRDSRTGAPRATFAVGIEPHDLLFARGGARLVVAVGGIARAADVKGPAINAGNIKSAIVELDPESGAVLKRHELPAGMRTLSLRHLAIAPDGETVAFGMQDQERAELRPLMGRLRVGGGIDLMPLPDGEDAGALRSYIGSVAIDVSGRYVAATSPKGGMAGFWSLADGRWLGGFPVNDVCGLAADEEAGCFWVTSGMGDVVKLRAGDEGLVTEARWLAPAAFDNHLLRL
jgi:hypothetical protein